MATESPQRTTPTTTSDPSGIDDDDYATEVDLEVRLLWRAADAFQHANLGGI